MQLGILSLGVMVFVFYLFTAPPLYFNPAAAVRLATGPGAMQYRELEARQDAVTAARAAHARALLAARRRGDTAALATADAALTADQRSMTELRDRTAVLIRTHEPGAPTSDVNYVFLGFVLGHLPVGLIGLVFAAVFAASMNSSFAELNSLASTTVVDVVGRISKRATAGTRGVWVSRLATLMWAGFAVAFAELCARLGSLIEAVNILGSLFYGTILGIFLTAFYLPRVGGRAVFSAAVLAEAVVIACFRLTGLSFLWYNLIGAAVVMLAALALEPMVGRRAATAGAQR